MRLNSFDLTRYGKFTDLNLSFGTSEDGAPDLHVIYGANEAGKSTLLSGWLDLLFQIPVQSPMKFLHPYTSMQLGAALKIDGSVHNVIRVKKRDHSLLDAQGAPIGEALIHGGLRGLDRASYAAMFSLNQQTLDEGGESILASEGDLGELLFQASAGLTDLSAQLDTLREDSLEFLNASGRKGRLRELNSEFDALGDQIKSLDTAAVEYARLTKERDAARSTWQNARKEVEATQTSVFDKERLAEALPLIERLGRLDTQISELGDLPTPPTSWIAELPETDRNETEMTIRLEASEQAVSDLEEELVKTSEDIEILDARDMITATDNLKSAYDTATADLPKRMKERDGETESVRDSLARLGQSGADPVTILPEVAVSGRLRGLAERHSGFATKFASAVEELERARSDADRSAQRLKQAGGSTADLGGLGGLVQNIRRDDPIGSFDRAQGILTEADAVWQERLTALAPWSGDSAAFEQFALPDSSDLERLSEDLEAATRSFTQEIETLKRLKEDADQREARQKKTGTASAVTLEDAAKIRVQREAEWSLHRANLNIETADRFEAAMRLDDQVATTVSDQRTRAEMALEAERVLADAQLQVVDAQIRVKDAKTRRETLEKTLAEIVAGMSPLLPNDMRISPFRNWLTKLSEAREALSKRKEAARKVSQCESTLERAQSGLRSALSQAGREMHDDTDLTLALETAQSLLDRATQIDALRETDQNARHDLTRREKAMTDAETALAEWQFDWEAACAETWMADAPPGVSEMRAVLDELDHLARHTDRVSDLNRRILSMQLNSDQFAKAIDTLIGHLNMPTEGSPQELWRNISLRLRNAETSQNQHADLQKRLILARQTRGEAQRKSDLHRTRTAEFTRFFSVTTWPHAREALTRADARAKLVERRHDVAEDLCTRMHTQTTEKALERLEGVDEASLLAGAVGLKADLKTALKNQDEAHNDFRKAQDALEKVGGDNAVARLEEQRQTLLLEMEDGARQHLQQRLGLLAVDSALRQYRDTHRSGMLDHASDAFRSMSRGRYSGLAAQPDGTREVLVALTAEGGSKEAEQLSDGTRAQLYLALRIAGYHEFVRNNGPVPFVADDIMESFDDDRAAEAFKLLAKMSETGQVIYLTHHAHVCEIAKETCPSVHIHDLPD